ncbi:MAG: trypsin-like peptidase domain-containing protein [Bradyrhizobium sp.]|uniref:S1C family serine protease n=1 Tax=Bradyrhizobium sp. TaxID=376 RepID=UPI001D21AEEA|nr:trypsin-like peptidase domain-containing protein [Bradyrhizobium sp.]MBV9564962.1 trypsin-like peptidase domain-containing protein [Bradyrhizobium sp.]
MRKAFWVWFSVAFFLQLAAAPSASAAGPYGFIHVGNWKGGAFTNDGNGTFSHCAASMAYDNGMTLVVGQNANNSWLLGFANPAFRYSKGETLPIDIIFDGQSPARIFGNATSQIMATAVLPPNVARIFQKSNFMAATTGSSTYQFNLTSTGPLLAVLANCVAKIKADGIDSAGDFTAPKPVATRPPAAGEAPSAPKSAKAGSQSGTGFAISAGGHVVTNHHVIDGCSGDIRGNLGGEAPVTLRLVSKDASNDLALLQAPSGTFKEFARIRDRAIHSGDAVVAIGYPFRGLLSSDFTVTTGIVSSLSGPLNDTRFLQISAAVQPGNSGGPLLDGSGQITGVVAAKLDAIRVARATGSIPENINFAIKTGALRDFLDNSAVAYETAEPKGELKTSEITDKARAYTLLISCNATEPVASAKK